MNLIKITKLIVRHHQAIHTTSMGFFQTVLKFTNLKSPDQITKHMTHQYVILMRHIAKNDIKLGQFRLCD